MSPFIARALDQVSTRVPREIWEALRDHLENNRVRNGKLARVLVEVLEALKDQGAGLVNLSVRRRGSTPCETPRFKAEWWRLAQRTSPCGGRIQRS
jgi:hypothetical protein